ncbi:MAG TPA: response regulator, partial [Polyangiaceae bacterium]|nr:response regulator [Polyangiaceae bacterium]
MSDNRVGINKRVADRLYDDGVIDESDYVRAVDHAKRNGMRVEESLIELDILPEKQLLKYIATLYKTQFVSTARMSKAKLDERALKLVPRGMAMHFLIYPLVLDRVNGKIIVATPDPDNTQALRELAVAAQVDRVVAMVARPEAVVAAIERGYAGDRSRFKKLLQARVAEFEEMLMADPTRQERQRRRAGQADWSNQLNANERRARRQESTGRPVTGEFAPPRLQTGEGVPRRGYSTSQHAEGRRHPTGRGYEQRPSGRRLPTGEHQGHRPTGRGRPPTGGPYGYDDEGYPPEPYDEPPRRGRGAYGPGGYEGPPVQDYPPDYGRVPIGPPVREQAPVGRTRLHGPRGRMSSIFPRPAGLSAPTAADEPKVPDEVDVIRTAPYMETLRVMVGLLENERADLRGHSAFVARLAQTIGERISLPEDQLSDVVIAAYIHDLGRMGALHLTALNVAQSEEHLASAIKLAKLPQQLTESVGLPDRVNKILDCLFERQGGGGIPQGLTGKDLPIGARIIAVADSYADLTRNPSNEYGRMLTPEEALDVLQQQAGAVFDLNIIDVLEKTTGGEKILTDLLADKNRVLIADPDPEQTMVLQLRLAEQGFDVHVARSLEEATKAIGARDFALVVSEIDLDVPEAGFELKRSASNQNKTMSWVFLSSRDDRDTAARALKLGVDDFIAKPVSTEILVAKLMQLVERQSQKAAPRGVSGSLAQMGIPAHRAKGTDVHNDAGPLDRVQGYEDQLRIEIPRAHRRPRHQHCRDGRIHGQGKDNQ